MSDRPFSTTTLFDRNFSQYLSESLLPWLMLCSFSTAHSMPTCVVPKVSLSGPGGGSTLEYSGGRNRVSWQPMESDGENRRKNSIHGIKTALISQLQSIHQFRFFNFRSSVNNNESRSLFFPSMQIVPCLSLRIAACYAFCHSG
jgi:hypothetical protein